MACARPDCSYMNTGGLLPPILQPNSDISGIGVLIGFVGIAYVTFILLVLRFLISEPGETNLDGSTNRIDRAFLTRFWQMLDKMWELVRKWAVLRKILPPLRKPSARFSELLKDVSIAASYSEIFSTSQFVQGAKLLPQATLAMSDAQIITGLSILVGGYSQLDCGLSIFHWHMVVRLAWFSSVTHLTTLTFLRRYIHDNRGIRILRLVLMLALMVMLAIALIPTGGQCGLENYNPWRITADDGLPVYPGSPAKCCFSAIPDKANFIGSDQIRFDLMMISEALLIGTSLTRAIKLFRSSSEFSKTWLRHKPAQMCKRVAGKLQERYYGSYLKLARVMYIAGYCTIMAFIPFARGVYDSVDSVFFEIVWLFFYLVWGTIRIARDRPAAGVDFAAKHDIQKDVVLQENSWGFGQLVPTLLLILPLFSLVEGVIEDDTAAALDEAPSSNRSSEEGQAAVDILASIDPCSELDIATNVGMVRTGTDLVNMENNLGSNSENPASTPTRRQSGLSSEQVLQLETEPQLRNSMHRWSAKTFYEDMVVIKDLIFERELDTHRIPAIEECPYIRKLVDVIDPEDGAHREPRKLVFEWMDTDLWKCRPYGKLSHQNLPQVISKSVLEALAVFQALNAVHTDISPNNILLSNLDQPFPIIKHSWKALKAEKANVPKRSKLAPQRYGKALAPGLAPTSRSLANVQNPFGPGGKIIKDHTDARCMAKIMRLRGRFDMTEEMDRYEEWRLATGLEAMDFKHPKTGEMRPYIVGGTLEEELERLPRELCSRECIEFILYLLELDDKKRPIALEALQHPFIKSTVTWKQQNLNYVAMGLETSKLWPFINSTHL
ncbi:hypothetical protein VF21_02796 [Pseudogymnoascus sp. 05NY08]|nr:hypothetical protein VF21_02796 [Pseudogymnoascus sp. 05NY08]